MFILARTVTYASLFIGLVLVFVPSRLLKWSGISPPRLSGPFQVAGVALAATGAALAFWCVATFILLGRGTPAPFDPPRCLVIGGPYRRVRNPMYLGAALALAGAALCFSSLALLAYLGLFLLAAHLFVVFFEEPALRGRFGQEYADYCGATRRWLPRR